MTMPPKIWAEKSDVLGRLIGLWQDTPCDATPYIRADRVEKLVEALQEQVALHAMDLTVLDGHADPETISDIKWRRDRARAALTEWDADQ